MWKSERIKDGWSIAGDIKEVNIYPCDESK